MAATNAPKGLKRLDARIDALPQAANLGKPVVADTDYYVADRAMANAAFTLLKSAPEDGTPARNVTVTGTQAGGSDDTFGTVTITGTNVEGATITEALVPVNGSTVAGTKAFATVTSVVQSGWTAGGTADRIIVGIGNLIGLPAGMALDAAAADEVFLTVLGGAVVAATVTRDADEPEKNTVDASAGTYNGTKRLVSFIIGH